MSDEREKDGMDIRDFPQTEKQVVIYDSEKFRDEEGRKAIISGAREQFVPILPPREEGIC